MITQTLKIWSKPVKLIPYTSTQPHQPAGGLPSHGPTKLSSSFTNNGEFVHWSPGKDRITKSLAELYKELHELWGGPDKKKYDWIVPGAKARPKNPEHRVKWSKEVEVVRCARNLCELNSTFPLPQKTGESLYTIFVKVTQEGRKDTGAVYRCTPEFLEELKETTE